MSDYGFDFTGALIAFCVISAVAGAVLVGFILWLASHLSIVVRWV